MLAPEYEFHMNSRLGLSLHSLWTCGSLLTGWAVQTMATEPTASAGVTTFGVDPLQEAAASLPSAEERVSAGSVRALTSLGAQMGMSDSAMARELAVYWEQETLERPEHAAAATTNGPHRWVTVGVLLRLVWGMGGGVKGVVAVVVVPKAQSAAMGSPFAPSLTIVCVVTLCLDSGFQSDQ
jgi:hypothetical protein